MQKAGQAPRGGFKVIEEARQSGLTATLGREQRQDKVADGMALMAVCVIKDQVDILKQASWSRALSFHNPILYRVNNSFHSPHSNVSRHQISLIFFGVANASRKRGRMRAICACVPARSSNICLTNLASPSDVPSS